MSGMTWNSLTAEILSYLNRSDADTTAQLPNFIYQAENRIARESKNIGLETYVVTTLIPGTSVYQKPGRWRRTLSLNYGSGTGFNTRNQLYLRSYEFVRAFWPNSLLTAPPQYYADYGYTNWVLAPTPDLAYPMEISYLELPLPLSPSNQTNWLTNYAPDVLLYACLLEAEPFLKNDERIPVWQAMYERALASLNAQDDQRIVDRASNREAD